VVVSRQIQALLSRDVAIDVKVQIAETGKVISAQPVKPAKGVEGHLTAAAVKAAQLWVFTPATINGKPVPSEAVVTFRFSRGGP